MGPYIQCSYLADADALTELEPMYSEGTEYLVRVVFKEGDRQWGQWMTTDAKELAEHLFA